MRGDRDKLNMENGTQPSRTLSDWIEAHKTDLLTALRPLANILCSTLGLTQEEIASELLVEVTHRALAKPTHYDPERPPKAWLLGIAGNVMLEWRDREIKWKLRYKHLPAAANAAEDEPDDPLNYLICTAQGDASVAVIGTIWSETLLHTAPNPHREIIAAYMETDFDTDATAKALGITNANARQRLVRARRWFKDRLHLTEETLAQGGRQ
jgi:DNA-directed RNA polymerase specialized sigma24 family protein